MKYLCYIIPITICLLLKGCRSLELSQGKPEPLPEIAIPAEPVKIALVLGGGGAKGLAHLGVLCELEEAGIHPDLIVGCSSGGIVGALYADNPNVKQLEPLLINLKKSDLIDFSFFYSKYGLIKGICLQNFLEKELQSQSFEQLKIPLIVVATDLHTGELIELGGGKIIPALVASAAIPGMFKPVKYLGRYLVDGGVANPIPVEVAKNYDPDVIIAVDVGENLSSENPLHFFGIAKRGMEISYKNLSDYVTRSADVVIKMKFQDIGVFSDSYNAEIYNQGKIQTKNMLPQIEKLIEERLACNKETGLQDQSTTK